MRGFLLDNAEISFAASDLPMLIHGIEGSGASLFSITVAAHLYAAGEKLIFLCGYPMAREEFVSQTASEEESVFIDTDSDFERLADKRVLFLKKEDAGLLPRLSRVLPDFSERVIFVKNCELFSEEVLSCALSSSRTLISGDASQASLPDIEWQTRIAFSPVDGFPAPQASLPRYSARIEAPDKTGIVSLSQ